MNQRTSEISFLVDTMIVETLLTDGGLSKTAQAGGLLSSLVGKVSGYVGNHIRPDDKLGSLLDILGPGAITVTLRALGFGWLSWLVGLAMSVFHINVSDIVKSVWDKLKSLIGSDNKQITSAQVDSAVSSSFAEHDKPMTEAEAEEAKAKLDSQKAFDSSAAQRLKDAQLMKLALIRLKKENKIITRRALAAGIAPQMVISAGLRDILSPRKKATTSLLSTIISWVLKIGLASAGLMVAGDAVNKMVGRPNALDDSMKDGKPVSQPQQQQTAVQGPVSKQTMFKVKSGYVDEKKNAGASNWVESIPNEPGSIENMLIGFALQVYDGLNGKEAYVRGAPGFQVIRDRIITYNRNSEGDNFVFIPKYLTSKKQLVDYFIDDVAETVPKPPQ
jgi:hypothetical protein